MIALRRISAEARINYVWIALSGLTALGFAVSTLFGGDRSRANGAETMAVLAIAGVKGRLIMREYMEVRTAPMWLRRAADAWIVGTLALIAVMYTFA